MIRPLHPHPAPINRSAPDNIRVYLPGGAEGGRPVSSREEMLLGEQGAYAKFSLMGSGAVLAVFEEHGALGERLGEIWFEMKAPAQLPACLLGHEIEIAAGLHPMARVMGKLIVLFRPTISLPQNTLRP